MTVWLSNFAAYSIQLAVLVATAAAVTSFLHLRRPRAAIAFWQALLVAAWLLPILQPWTGTTSDLGISTLDDLLKRDELAGFERHGHVRQSL